jgi:hypothetical protein
MFAKKQPKPSAQRLHQTTISHDFSSQYVRAVFLFVYHAGIFICGYFSSNVYAKYTVRNAFHSHQDSRVFVHYASHRALLKIIDSLLLSFQYVHIGAHRFLEWR